jgi:sulfite exporter TauE/SafE
MELALILSAALMGLAGTPHCLAMCGSVSAGIVRSCAQGRPGRAAVAFHVSRLAGYAAGGAVAASSVALLRTLGEAAPLLHPFWVMLHLAALGLGLWLVGTGRQPRWLEGRGRPPPPELARSGWQRMQGPAKAGVAGALWLAWPCGLLQSALVVATLGSTAAVGAAAMAAFAIASSLGLLAGPALWLRFGSAPAVALAASTWPVRLAGLALAGASAWALGHGLWSQVAAFCFGA